MKMWLGVLLMTLALAAMMVEGEESEDLDSRLAERNCGITRRSFWRRDCWRRRKRDTLAELEELFDVSI